MEKINLKPNQIIECRDRLTKDIRDNYRRIIAENIINKGDIRNFDIKKCYNSIKNIAEKRILAKLYVQAINMGYTDFSNFPAESLYYKIFELSEISEMIMSLTKIPTMDRDTAFKKYRHVDLTKEFLTIEKKNLEKRQLLLKTQISEYNNKAELLVTKGLLPYCYTA